MTVILNCNCGREEDRVIRSESQIKIGISHKRVPDDYDGCLIDNKQKLLPLNYCPSCGIKTTHLEIYVDWLEEINEVIKHYTDKVELIPFKSIIKGDQITIMYRDGEETFIAFEDAYELTACGEHKGYRVSGEKTIGDNEQLRMV